MSSPVITIDVEASVKEATRSMIDHKIGSILVTKQGKPSGIVTEHDLIERIVEPSRDPSKTKIKEIMSAPLITISKETGILVAMRKMREYEISRLVVMDDDTLLGILSEKDIVRAVSISSITSFSTLLRKKRR
jgi:CBS domain-containing protein